MLTVSDALKNAFMEPERTVYVRIKIGNRTFDNDNVISVEYDSGSLSGEVFAIGSTYSNSIKITFSELVEGLKELDEVIYDIGIKLPDGTIGYVPMGTFVINDAIEMDRNNNKTTIECMDRMVMLGGTYVSSLTYPAPIREVALEIVNKAGVTVDVTSFERLSADRIAKPEGYTYREAIGLIAQFEAGFATFNRSGKLEIRTLTDPNFAIPPDNYFSKGLVKNEVFFRLGGISCTTDDGDTIIQSGNSAGNQVVLENRVMTKILLDKIYQKIQTINYYPFSLSWQGNPVIEAGDWVEVEDLQGNKFKTPNLSYSLSFNGGLSAKSSAETVTQSDVTYQYKSPLQQKIEWIHARIDAAGGNVVYEGIDEPANPKEGDLWFKIIGPDKEILIYKKDKDGTLFWEPQISTADIDKVAKEVEAIIKQADADRVKAEQDIEQAVTDAKNYTEVKAQEFDNQLIIVNQDLVVAKQSADSALTKADQAIQDVGFMEIDVSTAKTNAATALENANTAKSSANTALTNANTALTKVGALEVTTGSLQASYNELTKTVGLKADKTTVDGINNKVTQHALDISANAIAVGLKADKSVVDSIKGTVDKHTLDIKAAADGLTLKADSNLVNTIKGTVDTHTTQISANSQAITARLTSAQVETLLTDKKYVNETTLNATANSLSASITQVSNDLSGLEIGGRNLLIRTGELSGRWLTGNEVYPNASPGGNGFISTMKNLIPVVSGDSYVFTKLSSPKGTDNYWRVSYLDSGINYVTRFVNTDNLFEVIIPIGVHFMWVSYPQDANPKVEKGTKATDWTPAPEDMATLEQFTTIDATVKGLQTTVGNKAEQSQVTQLAGQISSKVESATYNSKMTQLDSAISLRVTKGDVTAQINVEAGVTLISNKKLLLDANTYIMGTTFANDVKAKSLEAVYADIATLKTKVLTADAITSTMVKSDLALIDKLFATDANVNRLTAKTAFINSVKAVDISADKITTGTLFGNNVTASGINVSTIVGNISNFIQSNWNGLSSTVSITAAGMRGYSSTWGESLYQGGRLDFTITDPNDRSNYSVGLDPYKIQFSNSGWGKTNIRGQSEGLLIRPELTNTGSGLNSSIHLSGNITYLQFNDLGNNGVRGRIEVSANSTRFMSGNIVHFTEYNSPGVYQRTQALAYYTYDSVNTYNNMAIIGNRIQFVNENSNSNIYITPAINGKLVVGKSSSAVWYNVECLTVTQKSTRRIKDNIIPLSNIGLDTVNALTVVEYDLKQNLARGVFEKQVGFIFEDSPSIANQEGESIDLGRVGAYAIKGIQELSTKVKQLEQKIQEMESVT